MHSYSIDSGIRRTVYCFTVFIALSIPALFLKLTAYFGMPPSVGFPLSSGVLLAGLHLVWDKWVWRLNICGFCVPTLINLPDLNGDWVANGVSNYVDPVTNERKKYSMDVKIKQTFSRIEVFTDTTDSTSRSTLAGFATDSAVGTFRYAFENKPKNHAHSELQRHPGLIELTLKSSTEMAGDYFSGKHRLRYGELTLTKVRK